MDRGIPLSRHALISSDNTDTNSLSLTLSDDGDADPQTAFHFSDVYPEVPVEELKNQFRGLITPSRRKDDNFNSCISSSGKITTTNTLARVASVAMTPSHSSQMNSGLLSTPTQSQPIRNISMTSPSPRSPLMLGQRRPAVKSRIQCSPQDQEALKPSLEMNMSIPSESRKENYILNRMITQADDEEKTKTKKSPDNMVGE